MGMFDTVTMICPYCQKLTREQSKAWKRNLETFTIEEAPPVIQADMAARDYIVCDHCHDKFKVTIQTMVSVRTLDPLEYV